jgi:hypothetical protein
LRVTGLPANASRHFGYRRSSSQIRSQNPIYVLDFAFTFPLLAIGAAWLWRRRAWGYVVAGMMVVMLTIETAGIAIDQAFGHLHDPLASLAAVPIMVVFTAAGLVFSTLFLRGMGASSGMVKRPTQEQPTARTVRHCTLSDCKRPLVGAADAG